MANCDKYDQKILWAYLRDQLPIKEMVNVQYHLSVCEHCRKRLDNMRQLSMDTASAGYRKKKKILFINRIRLGWAASFFILFLGGISYYMVSTKQREYPIEIKKSPTIEEVDSIEQETDSVIIRPDTLVKNNFE